MNLDEIVKAIHNFMQEFHSFGEESENVKSSIHTMEICIQRLVTGTKSSVSTKHYLCFAAVSF